MVAGRVDDLPGGLALATESIDSGKAVDVLDALIATSRDELRRQPG
jgi:anthranilate phosphoribosyltransferase